MFRSRVFATTALTHLSLAIALSGAWSASAYANPEGGVVSGGSADIIATTDKKLDIYQHTDRAIIDWRSFNIGIDEHTQFHQPSSGSIALNRVNSADPSYILGRLSANGNVILINPNGVFFVAGSRIDVNGLIATTADITNQNFMNGQLKFDKAGNVNASLINEGHITAGEAGLVGLVAPNVINTGIIEAKLGRVHLAGGDTATVDLYGDGLMEVAVEGAGHAQTIINTGVLSAEGGHVAMTAAAGKDIVDNLIVVKGELKAPSLGSKNGKITIFAEGSNAVKGNTESAKGKKSGNSGVVVQASLDVSGKNAGERGGTIKVLGDDIALLNGTIMNASGHTGLSNITDGKLASDARTGSAGGDIRIGGDYLGQGDTATAKNLFVDTITLFYIDALKDGDAGRTIFWSDGDTVFKGNVYARGGIDGGNGGFVETSGKVNLTAQGFVDLTAEKGRKGLYFLDPTNILIQGHFTPDDVAGLQIWLDATTISQGDGTSVSTWDNLVSANADATAPGTQPTFSQSAFGGRGGVSFGTNSRLETGSYPIQSIFTVARSNNASFTDYEGIIGGAIGNPGDGHILNGWASTTSLYSGPSNSHFSARQNGLAVVNGNMTNLNAASGWLGSFVGASAKTNSATWIGQISGGSRGWNGQIGEILAYSGAVSDANRAMIEQYQSLKWGITLDPLAGAGTEAAEAMHATNGYSGFTTRYLEHLSQSADISLHATNDIVFDLKGDTLTLQADRNLTLNAGHDIKTTLGSGGEIRTSRTGTGGNISMTAGNDIDLNNIAMRTGNGNVTINATGNVALTTIDAGTGNINVSGNNLSIYSSALSVAPGSLVAYYNLDEGSGTTATDSSGYNVTGTMVGSPSYSASVPNVSGNQYSLNLNGSNYVSLSSNPISGNGAFTLSGWMSTNAFGAYSGAISIGSSAGSQSAYIGTVASAQVGGSNSFGGGFYGYNIGSGVTGTNQWHYVTLTYSGGSNGTAKMYVDGVLTNTTTYNPNISASLASLGRIGTDTSYNFNGLIDEARIYNTALTDNDVSTLYNGISSWQGSTINFNATNNIALDLGGNTMNAGSLTMTAGNDISSVTAGNLRSATGNALISAGNDINFAHDQDINVLGSGSATLRAGNSIIYTGSGDITTQGGAITLNSDYHATTPNSLGSISLGSGTNITSNNGNILMGGGTDGTGYAYGTSANASGININGAALSSGTGSITLRGNGYAGGSAANSHGIWLQSSANAIQSTTGAISLYGRGGTGTAGGHDGWGNMGIYALNAGILSNSGHITLDGTSGTGNLNWNAGVVVYTGSSVRTGGSGNITVDAVNNSTVGGYQIGSWIGSGNGYLETQNGNITLTSTATRAEANSNGLHLYTSTNGLRTTGSGNIQVTASADTLAKDIYYGAASSFGSGTATGNISILANTHNFIANPTFTTTGNVTFAPRTTSTTVGVAGGAGVMNIPSAVLGNITAGTVTFGRNDGTSILTVGAYDWSGRNYDLRLINGTGRIAFATGATIMGNNSLFAQNNEFVRMQSGSSITSTTAGDAIVFNGASGFFNASGSAAPIAVTGGGRWLIYAPNTAGTTLNGMTSDFRRFSCSYGGSCPTLGTGNGFLYANTPLLTVTPNASSVIYGDALPAFGYTLSGYLDSDSSADGVTGSANYSTLYSQGSNAGSYDITAAIGTLASSIGYGFTGATRSNGLTVDKKTLTATLSGQTATYGDVAPTLSQSNTSHINFTGFYGADNAAGLDSVTFDLGGYTQGSNAGTYTLSLSAFSDNNYTMSLPGGVTTGTLTVGKKILTATVLGQNATYGDAVTLSKSNTSHITYTGLYGADTGADLDSVTFSYGGYTQGSDSNTYTLGLSAFSDNNYTMTLPGGVTTGTLNVGKKALTATVQNQSIIYGANAPTLSKSNTSHITFTGLYGADTGADIDTLTYGFGGYAPGSNVGNYALSVATFSDNNYSLTLPAGVTAGTMTVGKANLLIKADDFTRGYGLVNPDFTATYTGLVAGDTSSVVTGLGFTTTALQNSLAGDYTITPANANAANYNISYGDGILTITGAPPQPAQNIIPDTVMYVSQNTAQALAPAPTPVPGTDQNSSKSSSSSSSASSSSESKESKEPSNTTNAANKGTPKKFVSFLEGLLKVDSDLAEEFNLWTLFSSAE